MMPAYYPEMPIMDTNIDPEQFLLANKPLKGMKV